MLDPVTISILSLVVSLSALYLTYKKEAHRIRLRLTKLPRRYVDFISVINDSSFPVRISAVGHIGKNGTITWFSTFGNAIENKAQPYPITIDARATFNGQRTHGGIPDGNEYGYCVQLDCGRTFFIEGNLTHKTAQKYKLMSLISRITSGSAGFPKNDIHIKS